MKKNKKIGSIVRLVKNQIMIMILEAIIMRKQIRWENWIYC